MNLDVSNWGPVGLARAFKDEWLTTRQAVRLFSLSCALVLAVTPFFFGVDVSRMPLFERLPLTPLGMFGALAIVFLWLGMWRYWVRIDDSKAYARRFWFIILLIGFWWGSCLYFFFSYFASSGW